MTDTPPKIVEIRLSSRNLDNDPDLFERIETAFKDRTIKIDMTNSDVEAGDASDEEASQAVLKSTGDALDLNDQLIKDGVEKVPTPEEAESRLQKWLKIIREQAFIVSARAVLTEIIKRFIF